MVARVALDDQPAVAARGMEPEFAVQPGRVVAQVHIVVDRGVGRALVRTPRRRIAVVDEFVVAARAAMGGWGPTPPFRGGGWGPPPPSAARAATAGVRVGVG